MNETKIVTIGKLLRVKGESGLRKTLFPEFDGYVAIAAAGFWVFASDHRFVDGPGGVVFIFEFGKVEL